MDSVKPTRRRAKPVNDYYLRLAARVRNIRYLAMLSLLLVVLAGITLFNDEITLKNLTYLLRYLDVQTPDEGTDFADASLYIDGSPEMSVGFYKGDVALVKETSLAIYDFAGSKAFEHTFSYGRTYSRPQLLVGDKYILTYDLAGNKFDIFNSFSLLFSSEKQEGPVYKACLNDAGYFAVVSTASGYRSVVTLYSPDFKQLFRWSTKDKYVMDAALDKSGKHLAAAAFSARDGDYLTTVSMFDAAKEEPLAQLELTGCLPMDVEWIGDGKLALVTDQGLGIYDNSLQSLGSFDFDGRSLYNYRITDKYIILALKSRSVDNSTYLYVLNAEGQPVYTATLAEELLDVASSAKSVYVLSRQSLIKIKPDSGELIRLDYDPLSAADRIVAITSSDQAILASAETVKVYGERLITSDQPTLLEESVQEPTASAQESTHTDAPAT